MFIAPLLRKLLVREGGCEGRGNDTLVSDDKGGLLREGRVGKGTPLSDEGIQLLEKGGGGGRAITGGGSVEGVCVCVVWVDTLTYRR